MSNRKRTIGDYDNHFSKCHNFSYRLIINVSTNLIIEFYSLDIYGNKDVFSSVKITKKKLLCSCRKYYAINFYF